MPGSGTLGKAVFVSFLVFGLTMVLSIGLWVFRDARARGNTAPFLWAVVAAVLSPFGLLYYLSRRYRRISLDERSEPQTKYDRLLGTWASTSLIAFIAGAIIAPPDPIAGPFYTLILAGILLPVMSLLIYRGWYRTLIDRSRQFVGS